MSQKSASRQSTPQPSTRWRVNPKQPPSPATTPCNSRSSTPDTSTALNLTLYGISAPIGVLHPRIVKKRHCRDVPPPPTTPVDEHFISNGVIVLDNSPCTLAPPQTTETAEEKPPVDPQCEEETNLSPPPCESIPSHRSISPLNLSSLTEDDDDDDVIESKTDNLTTETSQLSKSITITDVSGSRVTSDNSSSFVTISAHSTHSCSSLPRDDNTLRSQCTEAIFQNGDDTQRSEKSPVLVENVGSCSCVNSSVYSMSSPGHRRFILERLESGYYSPDTTDVRFSVSEVLEAAEYANRLATLLDQALGRELGSGQPNIESSSSVPMSPNTPQNSERQNTVAASSNFEIERKKFFENIGGNPIFQNVCKKIEIFESGSRVQNSLEGGRTLKYFRDGVRIERENVNVPIPPPLPYEGFQTVHDGKCHCCGPRILHFSCEDLQRQRSMLKKVPVEEKVEASSMNLQDILKDVIARRRDGVMPREDGNSGRSEWSLDESCGAVHK